MTTLTIFLYIVGAIVSWVIFYFVVKGAVRNGIKEARADNQGQTIIKKSTPERPENQSQVKLQQQYDNGEITFEEFQTEWNKLRS